VTIVERKREALYSKLTEGIEFLKDENDTLFKKLRRNKLQILKLLIKIVEEIDPYTKGHSIKVYRYTIRILKRLKLKKKDMITIGKAALLHDIGKIAINKDILNKPGRLTEKEYAAIKAHPRIGAEIAQEVKELKTSCQDILYHHLWYNGRGYPFSKLQCDDIPLGARIIAVADGYDAMTSNRPYRKAFDKEHAIGELKRCSGTQYDPKIVEIFITILKTR